MANRLQHGAYSLDWQGDVLVAQYVGAWNEFAAKAMHEDAAALWLARQGKSWALLSDARTWEGGTPETFEIWWQFFADGVAHGMQAVTDVLPSHFHTLLVRSLAERASQLTTYKNSQTIAEAYAWLAEQGFKTT